MVPTTTVVCTLLEDFVLLSVVFVGVNVVKEVDLTRVDWVCCGFEDSDLEVMDRWGTAMVGVDLIDVALEDVDLLDVDFDNRDGLLEVDEGPPASVGASGLFG
jgi:hypothetical protein